MKASSSASCERTVTVLGTSMRPTVAVGAHVRVRPAPVAVGEVALFRMATGYLLHRLLARLPGGLVLHAGDQPGSLPGIGRARDIVGRAELAARPITRAAKIIALARAVRSRFAGRGLV